MIHLDAVIDVTKLDGHVDTLMWDFVETQQGNLGTAKLNNIKFLCFGYIDKHRDSVRDDGGRYIYHLIIRNNGILISDGSNYLPQYAGSIVGFDVTKQHCALTVNAFSDSKLAMITTYLIFNRELNKSELIREFTSLSN